jgi:hypothetical protein
MKYALNKIITKKSEKFYLVTFHIIKTFLNEIVLKYLTENMVE